MTAAAVTRLLPRGLGADLGKARSQRMDHASVHDFGGTYGEYVLAKTAKVFPHLFRSTA